MYKYQPEEGQSIEQLLECAKIRGLNPIIDSGPKYDKGYPPEDIGEYYLHMQMKRSLHRGTQRSGHKRITTNPEEASIFIVNTAPQISKLAGFCNGMNHEQRQEMWVEILLNTFPVSSSKSFLELYPKNHAFICQSWQCSTFVSDKLKPLVFRMTYLIHEKNLKWIGIQGYDHDNIIVVPYVAHSEIQRFQELPKTPNFRDHRVSFFGSFFRKTPVRTPLLELERVNVLDCGKNTYKDKDKETRNAFHEYPKYMRNSTFCLIPEGDTASSRRLFDAMLAGCIPVFIGSEYERPFEDIIRYDLLSIKLDLLHWLRGGAQEEIDKLYDITSAEIGQYRQQIANYLRYIDWRHGDYVFEAIVHEMVEKYNLGEVKTAQRERQLLLRGG